MHRGHEVEESDGVRGLMSDWEIAETNTHQDHVIAHVIGASVLGYFTWDETAYLLLDIGFIWNIYLDAEMGLVPQSQAVNELSANSSLKSEIREDVDAITMGTRNAPLKVISVPNLSSPIQTVELFSRDNAKRLVMTCEESTLVVETSLNAGEVNIHEL
jgi:hypothetical protein